MPKDNHPVHMLIWLVVLLCLSATVFIGWDPVDIGSMSKATRSLLVEYGLW